MTTMRIVHIDETFHPQYGYQVNPLAKFQRKAGHEVYIVTVSKDKIYPVYEEFGDRGEDLDRHDAQYEAESGVKIVRVPVRGYISGRAIYTGKLFEVVRGLEPDVVFAHLVESFASIMLLLRRKEYPLVFDSHMLAMASANRLAGLYEFFYKAVISRIIRKNKYIVIRAQDDDYVITHLGIPPEQAPYISFGSDTSVFKPDPEARARFRKEHAIAPDEFAVIFTGKLSEGKGAMLLASGAQEVLRAKNGKKALFIVVGNAADRYGEEIEHMLADSENRVLRFPTQNYMDLAGFYQAADLSVFPKQCSLSFFDAQACGLPVLSEDNNINIERCSHGNGMNFEAGNSEDFRKKILGFMEMDEDDFLAMSANSVAYIKEGYDYEYISGLYTGILESEYRRLNAEGRGRR